MKRMSPKTNRIAQNLTEMPNRNKEFFTGGEGGRGKGGGGKGEGGRGEGVLKRAPRQSTSARGTNHFVILGPFVISLWSLFCRLFSLSLS